MILSADFARVTGHPEVGPQRIPVECQLPFSVIPNCGYSFSGSEGARFWESSPAN
jgi:hypothetical protein